MLPTWPFTVRSLTNSSAAISVFDAPRATSASTSTSRSDSGSSTPWSGRGAGRADAQRRQQTRRDARVDPRSAERDGPDRPDDPVGLGVLEQEPGRTRPRRRPTGRRRRRTSSARAPAARHRRGSGASPRGRPSPASARPSARRRGGESVTARSPSSPLPASDATSMPGSVERMNAMPARTSGWSSTRTTRSGGSSPISHGAPAGRPARPAWPPGGQPRRHRPATGAGRGGVERAADGAHPLPHALRAEADASRARRRRPGRRTVVISTATPSRSSPNATIAAAPGACCSTFANDSWTTR